MTAFKGTRIGTVTLCGTCGKAIKLVRSRNPDTQVDRDFWVHFTAPETHMAVPKRPLCYCGQPVADGFGRCRPCINDQYR